MKRLNIVLVVVVILVAVLLSAMATGTMQRLQAGFLGLVSPFLKLGSGVQQQFGAMGKVKTLDQLEKENAELNSSNKRLQAENQILRDMEAEVNRLRDSLGYVKNSEFKLVAARVISRDASTWWNTIKINRGFEDGLKSDQPVLTDQGLVGKTTTVGKNEAIVLLVTDETCRVAAKVEGSREQGIISGLRAQSNSDPGQLQLNFLSKNADLQPGQKIYTAGVSGGVFPSGILIGEVQGFSRRPLDGQAIVNPVVDLPSLEDVFVVVGAK